MSEPTLYQERPGPLTWDQELALAELQSEGVLVPVERCEHGKVDKHPTSGSDRQGDWTYWCPGAGIGGDE